MIQPPLSLLEPPPSAGGPQRALGPAEGPAKDATSSASDFRAALDRAESRRSELADRDQAVRSKTSAAEAPGGSEDADGKTDEPAGGVVSDDSDAGASTEPGKTQHASDTKDASASEIDTAEPDATSTPTGETAADRATAPVTPIPSEVPLGDVIAGPSEESAAPAADGLGSTHGGRVGSEFARSDRLRPVVITAANDAPPTDAGAAASNGGNAAASSGAGPAPSVIAPTTGGTSPGGAAAPAPVDAATQVVSPPPIEAANGRRSDRTQTPAVAKGAAEGSLFNDAPRRVNRAAAGRAVAVDQAVQLEQLTGAGGAATGALGTVTEAPGSGTALVAEGGVERSEPLTARSGPTPFTARVVRGLSAMVNHRGGVMSMRLDPPELGQLRVQMQLHQGVVSAQFHATTAQAYGLLEQNMTTLQQALESSGLTVERLTVHLQPGQGNGAAGQDGADEQQSNHRDPDAGDGRSRGRRDSQDERRDSGTFAQLLEPDAEELEPNPFAGGDRR